MITKFNSSCVYVGYSREKRNSIIRVLAEHKIPYKTKEWQSRLQGGSFGQLAEYQIAYEIYVHRKDYDQAVFVINQQQ